MFLINHIPAGVLEKQDTPPLWIPCLMSTNGKWYIIGKLLCSTFSICKIPLCSKNVCKKNVQNWQNKHSWKAHFIQYYIQNNCTILNNLMFNWGKLKICKFLLTGCMLKIWKLVQSVSVSKKPFRYQNWTEIGSKQRFSLLQEKVFI